MTEPNKIWLIWPDDGSEPVLWLKPCPFPVDDGTVTEYTLARDKTHPLRLNNAQLAEEIDLCRHELAPFDTHFNKCLVVGVNRLRRAPDITSEEKMENLARALTEDAEPND